MNTNASHTRRGRRFRPWIAAGAAAVLVIVGGVVGGLVVKATDSSSADSNSCPAKSVARRVLPSVVTIAVSNGVAGGTGSGEVIRSNGYILTNNHVIAAAANGGSVNVLLSDGATESATITGRDPRTDLAVIKVSPPKPLPVIPIGSSAGVEVGQPVIVLGAPLGLSSTVTSGIVSALDRSIEVPADEGATALLVGAIQTDAAINPGNSGGAMTDCAGNLVGVPTAGASVPNESGQSSAGSVGLGFAIPVDFAKRIADEIIATGSVIHSSFGIQAAQIPPAAAQQAGTSGGIYVSAVAAGGPAALAGLRTGDIITKVNGTTATNPNQLTELTLTERPGATVEIGYVRAGRSATTTVTLAASA